MLKITTMRSIVLALALCLMLSPLEAGTTQPVGRQLVKVRPVKPRTVKPNKNKSKGPKPQKRKSHSRSRFN